MNKFTLSNVEDLIKRISEEMLEETLGALGMKIALCYRSVVLPTLEAGRCVPFRL